MVAIHFGSSIRIYHVCGLEVNVWLPFSSGAWVSGSSPGSDSNLEISFWDLVR